MRTLGLCLALVVAPTIALADPVSPPDMPADSTADFANARVVTGAAMFAGSYVTSAIVADTSDHVGSNHLYMPVAGPWLALDDWGNGSSRDKALLVADGVIQAAGLVVLIDGLIDPDRRGEKMLVSKTDTKFHLAPTGTGMMAWAHF